MSRIAVLVLSSLALANCGGSKPDPEAPTTDSSASEVQQEAEANETVPSSGPVSEMGDRPPPIPEAWELHQRDCDALGTKHERLLLAAELEKIPESLSDNRRASAEKNARDVAQQGTRNWLASCDSIVGTTQNKAQWDCAYRATTLDRFKGCLDGTFDTELNAR